MATIKVKFRPSRIPSEKGTIYYQVIHRRMSCRISTAHRVAPHEWDAAAQQAVASPDHTRESTYLHHINKCIANDLARLNRIIMDCEHLPHPYTAADVIALFRENRTLSRDIGSFADEIVATLAASGKHILAARYACVIKSFRRFSPVPPLISEITAELMLCYELHLKERGLCRNSTSFYMRGLRAIYNRAVDAGLSEQNMPFRRVFTGVAKTRKRAITLTDLRKIKAMDLKREPDLEFARDIFMFAFCTRGMSCIDIAHLQPHNLANGVLTYNRKKTGQRLHIKWEPQMQAIVDKYAHRAGKYLLPILRKEDDEVRTRYRQAARKINQSLKKIGEMIGLAIPLTLYVARHTWASLANAENIAISVISEALGHESERTTRIYLASLNTTAVDNANKMILSLL